jgi:hypothetical protein
MRARPTRIVSVTNVATQIRDITALPVTKSILRYSGATTIEVGPLSSMTFGQGRTIPADTDVVIEDQSLLFYAVASGVGPVSLRVTDMEA